MEMIAQRIREQQLRVSIQGQETETETAVLGRFYISTELVRPGSQIPVHPNVKERRSHRHQQGHDSPVHSLVGLHLYIILFAMSTLDSLMGSSRRQGMQWGRKVILGWDTCLYGPQQTRCIGRITCANETRNSDMSRAGKNVISSSLRRVGGTVDTRPTGHLTFLAPELVKNL